MNSDLLVPTYFIDSSALERAGWIQRGNLKNNSSFLSWVNLNTLQRDTRQAESRHASAGHPQGITPTEQPCSVLSLLLQQSDTPAETIS